LQDLFFAVKWLGNAGGHNEAVVTKDDVLDAYERTMKGSIGHSESRS